MLGLPSSPESSRRFLAFVILLGLFLTLRGYRSREGDQAYRLPLLLHRQDSRVFDDDPFVRAFDRFNPHRGFLTLLDLAGRPLGLSVALAGLFGATFLATCYGVDRLARSVWGGSLPGVGLVAVSLVLIAQAGNIGTNHLFEPILLDRLVAFGLGWLAIACVVASPRYGARGSALVLGAATLIHPSVGLQLTMLLAATWLAWRILGEPGSLGRGEFVATTGLLGVAVVPGLWLNLRGSGLLLEGLAPDEVRLLAAELQSPQHMLPHLWRFPQWLAWGCYPALALFSLADPPPDPESTEAHPARRRLVILLGLNLVGLALAWYGIERMGSLRLTLFQPFRLATTARGLCLVLVAGHVCRLWQGGGIVDRLRAVLIAVGLVGDWTLVVATLFDATMCGWDLARRRLDLAQRWPGQLAGFALLAAGMIFLARHDTESGHVPMLAAVAAVPVFGRFVGGRVRPWTTGRVACRLAASWAVPVAAIGACSVPETSMTTGRAVRQALIHRCRFAEVPVDDIERLAVWCRSHTPPDARFVGPPGPKTFRLWSLRNLAFNRAGSPYAAAGLADWARRFADHVGMKGPPVALVAAYLRDRQGLERRFDALSGDDKAALATRQGAGYVLALSPQTGKRLSLLHTEGRYAVYRVRRD